MNHYTPSSPWGEPQNGRFWGKRGGGFSIDSLLAGKPEAMLLFVGAVGCTRHRGFQMGELMRAGRMALLCPTATDFATGRYLHQIVEAMAELKEQRRVTEFVLMYGCQCALLSTDFDLIRQQLREEYGITLSVHESCHLCRTDHEDTHPEEEAGGLTI
jgi:hypothetical protein